MKGPPFIQFEHTADRGAECYGKDLKEAFESAARAMFAGFTRFEPTGSAEVWRISLRAFDYEELLVRWLGTLLSRHDTDNSLFLDYRITELTPERLEAEVDVAPPGHPVEHFGAHVKAVTFHGLEIKQNDQGAVIRVIFDV